MQAFQVQLDSYHGPLDLLLYLAKKQELPIAEVPLASVAQQYLEFVAILERMDPDAVGDFLDVASQLLELKSRAVLPRAEETAEGNPLDEDPLESPTDLVERLLQFKEHRDAATRLESRRIDWSRRRVRQTAIAKAPKNSGADRAVVNVELWDLVSAFARVMRSRLEPEAEPAVFYDETPVHLYMQQIEARLRDSASATPFEDLFAEGPVHKSTLVAVFLAVLELIRYGHAVAMQTERYGPIRLAAGPVPLPTPV